MKVMLIKPPLTFFQHRNSIQEGSEPLGLAYIASYLLKNGHDVNILDAFMLGQKNITKRGDFYFHGLSEEEITTRIREYNPDIVGISAMFTLNSKGVHDTARIAKGIKDMLVVVGGAHASSLPDLVLNDKNIDILVRGEGEETFLEIVNRFEKGKSLDSIHGTAVRTEKGIKVNPPRDLIKDLDSIPFPARHLLPMKLYMNDWYRDFMAMRTPRANVVTSRGCLGNCIFCSVHSVWGRTWRGRSPENVVEELEELIRDYKVREVAFYDDNISLNRDRMEEICDLMIKKRLNIKWSALSGVAIWTLDKRLLDKMKKSGYYKITFGIETGCPETQKFIRKTQIDLEKSKEIIKYCNRIGLWTHSGFVIGLPFETREHIEETVKYAIDSDLDMATFFIATPYPGTDMFDIYMKEGLIPYSKDMANWSSRTSVAGCDTKCLTKEEINNLAKEAHRRFYSASKKRFMNPMRILRKIHSIEDLKYAIRIASMSGKMIRELTYREGEK